MLYNRSIHGKPFVSLSSFIQQLFPSDSHRKLHHPWTGPYVVLDKINDFNYKIQLQNDPQRSLIVHFNRLKKCVPGTRFPPQLSHTTQTTQPQHIVAEGATLVDSDDNHSPAPRPLYLLHAVIPIALETLLNAMGAILQHKDWDSLLREGELCNGTLKYCSIDHLIL